MRGSVGGIGEGRERESFDFWDFWVWGKEVQKRERWMENPELSVHSFSLSILIPSSTSLKKIRLD